MTEVQIFTGFLGAGKTTLLNKLLPEYIKKGKTAIIENDFGDISVDTQILSNENVEIRELSSGCVCCSLIGDFMSSVELLIEKTAPAAILIEPSGLSRTSEILKAMKDLEKKGLLRFNPCINIVDANNFKDDIEVFGMFYLDQIEYAGLILLSHCEMRTTDELDAICKEIADLNPYAAIMNANWFDITGEALACQIFAAIGKLRRILPAKARSGGTKSDVSISSWNTSLKDPMSKDELSVKLKNLSNGKFGRVMRAKGFCASQDGGIWHFEYLPAHLSIETFDKHAEPEAVVIGQDLNPGELTRLFCEPIMDR